MISYTLDSKYHLYSDNPQTSPDQTSSLSSKLICNCLLDIYTYPTDIHCSSQTESTQVAEARNLDVISVFPLPEPKTVPTLKPIHHKSCCLTSHLFYFHSSSRATSTPPWTNALGSLQLFILLSNILPLKQKPEHVCPSAYLSNLIPLSHYPLYSTQ